MGSPVFEIYNADGSLQLNLSSRLSKNLGSIAIQLSVSGSIYDENLKMGTPWYCCFSASEATAAGTFLPEISVSNGTLTWTSNFFGTTNLAGTIIYGVYSNGVN